MKTGRKELGIGVIGCGGRGRLAWSAHNEAAGVRLVAGADPRPAARDQFQEKFGSDTFVTDDYRALLAHPHVDAVFVTSPDFLHEEHALAALDAGKPVYLEKPMAITIEGCDRILRKAFEKKLKLYLGHNMRHMVFTRKMKEVIDSGRIGEVRTGWCRHFVAYGGDAYYKDWHAEQEKANSLLLQKGAHDIDILHWLCGGYTRRVTAMGNLTVYNQIADRRSPSVPPDVSWHEDHWPPLSQKQLNPVIDVEDLSMMLMELDNGVLCSYQQCHYSPDAWRNYTVIGTQGRVENLGEEHVAVWDKRCRYLPEGCELLEASAPADGHGGADTKIVAEFVRYVREGGKIRTSAVAARNSVAAGCCAAHSLRHGSVPMDIPPLPEEILSHFSADVES